LREKGSRSNQERPSDQYPKLVPTKGDGKGKRIYSEKPQTHYSFENIWGHSRTKIVYREDPKLDRNFKTLFTLSCSGISWEQLMG
jgi:hypothetical protein